jgi:hypothetical protein
MGAVKNIAGEQFGRLLVLRRDGSRYGQAAWACRCACGNEFSVSGSSLRTGATRSCGCLNNEVRAERGRQSRTHGHAVARSPTYCSWHHAKARCNWPAHHAFADYGGRGIKMCERWLDSFENFLADMGPRPTGKTLDRYPNPNGDYEPGNCRWATWTEQAQNSRRTRLITLRGETKCMSEWARVLGVAPRVLCDRLKRGWPIERALTIPAAAHRKKGHR